MANIDDYNAKIETIMEIPDANARLYCLAIMIITQCNRALAGSWIFYVFDSLLVGTFEAQLTDGKFDYQLNTY